MRLRRLEGSPHKGLFKRAPRIQSPCFSQTSDHFQPSLDVWAGPSPHSQARVPGIGDDPNGVTWKVRLGSSVLGTQGGRCSRRLPSQPPGLDVCKCWGRQARDNGELNPPRQGRGRALAHTPPPWLDPQTGGLPAQARGSLKCAARRELGPEAQAPGKISTRVERTFRCFPSLLETETR